MPRDAHLRHGGRPRLLCELPRAQPQRRLPHAAPPDLREYLHDDVLVERAQDRDLHARPEGVPRPREGLRGERVLHVVDGLPVEERYLLGGVVRYVVPLPDHGGDEPLVELLLEGVPLEGEVPPHLPEHGGDARVLDEEAYVPRDAPLDPEAGALRAGDEVGRRPGAKLGGGRGRVHVRALHEGHEGADLVGVEEHEPP